MNKTMTTREIYFKSLILCDLPFEKVLLIFCRFFRTVTIDEKYAIKHNNKYFNGDGKILSMDVDGRDVLISPTGNREEAIYAPLKYSIDVNL